VTGRRLTFWCVAALVGWLLVFLVIWLLWVKAGQW
jgi:hypothetical protein